MTGKVADGCSITGDMAGGGASSSREWTEDTGDGGSSGVNTKGRGKSSDH